MLTETQFDGSDHLSSADHAADVATVKAKRGRKAEQVGDDQDQRDAHYGVVIPDLRFSDPLVAEIAQLHRMRRRWMKAKNALILQGKAFSRAYNLGDKDAGSKAFDRVISGKPNDEDMPLVMALAPFVPAIARFDADMAQIEKTLVKMAKKLPVAVWVENVRGFGFASLASIVGECGDLSAYHTVSGVWKRCGLAVIDGEGRQRKVADAERALTHGYSPERRSVLWNVAEPMARLQRTWIDKETGEVKKPADPYGVILEAEKAKALAAGLTPAHAEARAKRHMTKRLLRDLTVEWRRVAGRGDTNSALMPDQSAYPPELLAAE